jgi:phosphoglycolate phosphatase-like HAD superfamily hydrolase
MQIYIDFDGTLFNSTKLYNDFIKFFKKYNIDELSIICNYCKCNLEENDNYCGCCGNKIK